MGEVSIDRFDRELALVGSHERAGVLVDVLARTDDPAEKRALLAHWFNTCDALLPWRDELRDEMEKADGVFTDSPDELAKLTLPITVYRGAWADDEAHLALSWSTQRS